MTNTTNTKLSKEEIEARNKIVHDLMNPEVQNHLILNFFGIDVSAYAKKEAPKKSSK